MSGLINCLEFFPILTEKVNIAEKKKKTYFLGWHSTHITQGRSRAPCIIVTCWGASIGRSHPLFSLLSSGEEKNDHDGARLLGEKK